MCSYASEIIKENDPRYPFATIHANPPGIATDYPALLKTNYGKGTVIWSCVPFEKADRFQHSDIFCRFDPVANPRRTGILLFYRSRTGGVCAIRRAGIQRKVHRHG